MKTNFRIITRLAFILLMLCSALGLQGSEENTLSAHWSKGENKVKLEWEIAESTLISHIIVQRKSKTESSFTNIGYLLSEESTESQTASYSYTDNTISSDHQYTYRISIVYENGDEAISDTTQCFIGEIIRSEEEVYKYIFPNPAKDDISIRLIVESESKLKGGFYTKKGQKLMDLDLDTIPKGLSEHRFDITELEDGEYLLILKIGSENIIEKIKVSR